MNDGFLLAGIDYSTDNRSCDGKIIKIDSEGNFLWEKTYRSSNCHEFKDIIKSSDGNFLIAGLNSILFLKINENGDIIWQSIYGNFSYIEVSNMIISSDNNYLLSGVLKNSLNDYMPIVLKINKEGNILWLKTYEIYSLYLSKNEETQDGYLIFGNGFSQGIELFSFIMKIDYSGNILWL